MDEQLFCVKRGKDSSVEQCENNSTITRKGRGTGNGERERMEKDESREQETADSFSGHRVS